MKKILNKIYLIFIILIIMCAKTVIGASNEFDKPEYTEAYKKWIELTDEEKQKAIEPSKYQINTNESNEQVKFSNQNVNLKSLLQIVKASSYSTNSKFSLKELIGNNLIIKDQQNTNSCWAFSGISSLETNLALKDYYNKNKEITYDYSERHMVYSMTQSLKEQINSKGWYFKPKDGGNFIMATAYLTNGSGAISESDMEFIDNEDVISISDIQNKTVQTTVDDVRYFGQMYMTKNEGAVDLNGTKLNDMQLVTLKNEMKEHISTKGSLYTAIYMPTLTDPTNMNLRKGAIYCKMDSYNSIISEYKTGGVYTNHGVSIIGWDDNYSKENFATKPSKDGAWIVRNSYGESKDISMKQLRLVYPGYSDENIVNICSNTMNCILSEDGETLKVLMGDNGIFYISYEDAYIYSGLTGIENAHNEKKYDNLYQYDELGGDSKDALTDSNKNDTYLANVFTRTTTQTEYLTSIGFESLEKGTYEVYINPNGADKSLSNLQKAELVTGDDITLTPGYHTINLKNAYELKEANFVIAIKMKHKDGQYSYFTYESQNENPNFIISNSKESFVVSEQEVRNDSKWIDIGDKNSKNFIGNLCIKGITVNNYSGTIANGDKKVDEMPKEDEKTSKNSNYDKATAQLQKLKIETNEQQTSINISIIVKGIEVENLCEKYEHYFYISSNPEDKNIDDSKWIKVEKFEKQSDGTYTLKLEITDELQLVDIDTNDSIYVYIKEIAIDEEQTATFISKAIELSIDTSDLSIEKEGENSKVTYNPSINDKTIANKILPKTGYISIIVTTMLIISMIGIFLYIRYKYIDK